MVNIEDCHYKTSPNDEDIIDSLLHIKLLANMNDWVFMVIFCHRSKRILKIAPIRPESVCVFMRRTVDDLCL